ncbi:MAG: mechanosensitive ion channel, partial [Bacteroidales bacterium]|nr:mechanosensitive ion channel [Bacteroidales bacterium]
MKEIIEYEIFTVGNYSLKIYNLIIFIVLIAAVFVILFVIKRIIYRSKTLDLAKKYTVNRLIQYIIVTIAFIAGLNVLGFNISVLLAGSAAILVGAGFGLQDLFSDFISGIVLLLDGSLKVGDIIEV